MVFRDFYTSLGGFPFVTFSVIESSVFSVRPFRASANIPELFQHIRPLKHIMSEAGELTPHGRKVGCHPEKDESWWDTGRTEAGG